MNKIFGVGAILAALTLVPTASASIILDQDACTGTCGTSPFGTITLAQTTSTEVTITLTLSSNERFAGTGNGNANALDFNLSGVLGTVTIAGAGGGAFQTGFGLGPSPDSTPFGSFGYSVTCSACQGGQAGNPGGPLVVTVTSSGVGGVVIADFVGNGGGYTFASDIVGNNGNTGSVASKDIPSSVPEPTTLSLLGAGLLGLGFIRSRVRK